MSEEETTDNQPRLIDSFGNLAVLLIEGIQEGVEYKFDGCVNLVGRNSFTTGQRGSTPKKRMVTSFKRPFTIKKVQGKNLYHVRVFGDVGDYTAKLVFEGKGEWALGKQVDMDPAGVDYVGTNTLDVLNF